VTSRERVGHPPTDSLTAAAHPAVNEDEKKVEKKVKHSETQVQ
jgi:hypothetical protein